MTMWRKWIGGLYKHGSKRNEEKKEPAPENTAEPPDGMIRTSPDSDLLEETDHGAIQSAKNCHPDENFWPEGVVGESAEDSVDKVAYHTSRESGQHPDELNWPADVLETSKMSTENQLPSNPESWVSETPEPIDPILNVCTGSAPELRDTPQISDEVRAEALFDGRFEPRVIEDEVIDGNFENDSEYTGAKPEFDFPDNDDEDEDEDDRSLVLQSELLDEDERAHIGDVASVLGIEEIRDGTEEESDGVEIFDVDDLGWAYDASGSQPESPELFEDDGPQTPHWRILERAGFIIDALPIFEVDQRDATFDVTCELLEEFPHGSSHKAIWHQVERGATFSAVLRSASIKRLWREQSDLWLRRSRSGESWIDPVQRNAMTWVLAERLVETFGNDILEELLCGDWRSEWIAMPIPEPGIDATTSWFSYSGFLAELVNESVGGARYAETFACSEDTEWAYTHIASRQDFRILTASFPFIADQATSILSQMAKPQSDQDERS